MTKKVKFKIDHIDPLGQGVSKISDKIIFIPSTLPGEEGEAEILKESKGVAFATLVEIEKKSNERIDSVCPHFMNCNGCHYLHTNYENELEFKRKSLARDFQKFDDIPEIEVLKSPARLGYRNRIQLHYLKKFGLIGFHQYKTNRITNVENCKIFDPSMQEIFDDTLKNFQTLVKNQPPKGHIEIYMKGDQVQRSINKSYSDGGFTQVNVEMNQKALDLISKALDQKTKSEGIILDLFGGSGNLTRGQNKPSLVVDIYPEDKTLGHQTFLNLDLFNDESLDSIIEELRDQKVSQLVIDPPRSGFKSVENYVEAFNPERIIYMSCKPSTMARDLHSIKDKYSIERLILLDFFPSTYHYEGLTILERKPY